MPYAHIDRLYARAKILSFFDARLGLDFLEVDHPAIHLIVYPNGRTNQPTPKAKQSASGPAIRTIFDLQARRVEVHNGVALINDRSIPFQLAANNLGVVITYAPPTGHYLGEISCSDITAQQGKSAVVRSKLDLSLEAGHGRGRSQGAALYQRKTAPPRLRAALLHFAHPQWKWLPTATWISPK